MRKLLSILCLSLILLSCKKSHDDTPEVTSPPTTFSNVVILGNSITYSPPNVSLGWYGDWGMAASALDKDYVHLLMKYFQSKNAAAKVNIRNVAAFEQASDTYDLDANLKSLKDLKPDLLILRIGENVPQGFDTVAFAKRYQALIAYMKVDNSKLKVLAVGSFWSQHDDVNTIMSRYTPYISLAVLGNDISNYSFDNKSFDIAVQQHPGDKGMQAIADMIWAKVMTMASTNP